MSKTSNDRPPGDISPRRRRLLKWLTGGFLSLWGLGFAWVVSAFLKPPTSRRNLADRVLRVGSLDSFPVGRAQLVRHGKEPVYILRGENDSLIGLSAVCTHLHCILNWDEEQKTLSCPCHEGAFDTSGNVLKGPPPRALRRYRVESRLGQIYLHL